jgi:hypothetical protein
VITGQADPTITHRILPDITRPSERSSSRLRLPPESAAGVSGEARVPVRPQYFPGLSRPFAVRHFDCFGVILRGGKVDTGTLRDDCIELSIGYR